MLPTDIEKELLELLIRKYEKIYVNPDVKKHKRISLRMRSYAPYDRENQYNTLQYQKVNAVLFSLEKKGWISCIKEKTNPNYIEKIFLNVASMNEIYAYLGIQGKADTVQQILDMLKSYLEENHTVWCCQFIENEMNHLQATGKLKLLSLNQEEVSDVLKMLAFADRKEELLMNSFSSLVFHDTKYFKKNRLTLLCRILEIWNPKVAEWQEEYGRKLTRAEILRTFGVLNYPEILAFRGEIRGIYENGVTDFLLQLPCIYLHSDNMKRLKSLDCSAIQRVLIIENKANFYAYLNEHDDMNELVVFGSGHYGFNQALLFEHIQRGILKDTRVELWSDIDYGGFVMFHRLQKEIFSQLRPYHMDVETYERLKSSGMDMDESYCEKLRVLLDQEDYAVFHDVIKAMLESGKRIEQELELISEESSE